MTETPHRQTPLHERHLSLGARMVPFAGYQMPVQYSGIIDEHTAVRGAAGLFDVSHMGEFSFRGPGALASLEALVPTPVSRLAIGGALYTVLLNERGGIVDDVIIYRLEDEDFMVVVNAANREKDLVWCSRHLGPDCSLRDVSDAWALLALQGPRSQAILSTVCSLDLGALGPFQFETGQVAGARAIVSRTGYTGEDGFELYVSAAAAVPVWDELLRAGRGEGLLPAGLGARDSLRTEMKYSLYGQDIDDTTSPLEAGLGWLVKLDKGEFIGHAALSAQKEAGISRRLVGFEMVEPGIARHGYPIVIGDQSIGEVTSGTHSPTLGKAIGIGYVPIEHAKVGSELWVDIRGKARRAAVVKTPFYQRSK